MAWNTGNVMENNADGYLAEAKNIKGSYLVVATTDDFANLLSAALVNGSLCYCQADDKFYQYNGSSWVEKTFGTSNNQVEIALAFTYDSNTQQYTGTCDLNPYKTYAVYTSETYMGNLFSSEMLGIICASGSGSTRHTTSATIRNCSLGTYSSSGSYSIIYDDCIIDLYIPAPSGGSDIVTCTGYFTRKNNATISGSGWRVYLRAIN